jgi:hypothetical protein
MRRYWLELREKSLALTTIYAHKSTGSLPRSYSHREGIWEGGGGRWIRVTTEVSCGAGRAAVAAAAAAVVTPQFLQIGTRSNSSSYCQLYTD